MVLGLGVVALVAAAGGAWWAMQPEPVAEADELAEAAEGDPSRDETEDLMRQIGYVQ